MDTIISLLPKVYFVALVLIDTVQLGIHVSRKKGESVLLTFLGMWPILIFLLYLAVMTQFGIGAVSTLLEYALSKKTVSLIALVTLSIGYISTKRLVRREYPQLFRASGTRSSSSAKILFHYIYYSLGAFLFYFGTWFVVALWFRIFQGGYPM